jgi:hypothetical protein
MRRIGREDLSGTNPYSRDEGVPTEFRWRVYEQYKLVQREGEHLSYFEAQGGLVDYYEPLSDTPYLCLELARIAERKEPAEALEQWINRYGLLGLAYERPDLSFIDRANPNYEVYAPSGEYLPEVVFAPGMYKDFGGPGETLGALKEEVSAASEVLTLYEAALNKDDEKLEQVLLNAHGDPQRSEVRKFYVQSKQEMTGSTWIDALVDVALSRVSGLVDERLRLFAYPAISRTESYERQPLTAINGLTMGWFPRNLLGAIYLQFYWLIGSGGDLSRCKQCGRIISFAPPIPKSWGTTPRKPRSDKEFCSRHCRQNYHYHNVVKPRKQGKRA